MVLGTGIKALNESSHGADGGSGRERLRKTPPLKENALLSMKEMKPVVVDAGFVPDISRCSTVALGRRNDRCGTPVHNRARSKTAAGESLPSSEPSFQSNSLDNGPTLWEAEVLTDCVPTPMGPRHKPRPLLRPGFSFSRQARYQTIDIVDSRHRREMMLFPYTTDFVCKKSAFSRERQHHLWQRR